MTSEAPAPLYCSDLSLQAGEPLIGSATPTARYVLLEYTGAWGAKALNESDLPEAVKRQIDSFVKGDPLAKALLIRQPGGVKALKPRLILASVDEHSPGLYGTVLENYTDLLDLDLSAFFAGSREGIARLSDDPVFLVCTNGRRDPCCARRGASVSNALANAAAYQSFPRVWESTHIGGHRFAANLIVLPHGLLYGRVDPQSALAILSTAQDGQAYLPNLRGRTVYPPPAQAADLYLRSQTGERALTAFALRQTETLDASTWRVVFERRSDGKVYRLNVRRTATGQSVPDSCQLDKFTPVTRYSVELEGADTDTND
ncbi:MAG: hypothetical protein B6D39_08385 [Anaerolineae bacterium UTCFX2]|jgi:hypothetical protein|nr:hypothetical protein [Anaerolineae bacterium]MCZ7551966.1 hypothetical protein [Anaerolineales bacterium]OQY90307.1 MAG: hypothetical protein B6D39_08385 [Anaerolineae bacterium UTCFX2]